MFNIIQTYHCSFKGSWKTQGKKYKPSFLLTQNDSWGNSNLKGKSLVVYWSNYFGGSF